MHMKSKTIYRLTTTLLLLSAFLPDLKAQRIYQPAQFFFNQYLINPAMAGIKDGLHVTAGYTRQMDNIPGSPTSLNFTADYYAGKRVGVGLNVSNTKAGILQHTRALATYVYHLPVGKNNQRVSFGLSGGFLSQRIDFDKVVGDPSDPQLQTYNNGKLKADGEVGVAYTDNRFNVQFSVPSIREQTEKENKYSINRTVFYSSAAYLFELDEVINSITPKAAFTKIKGDDNILDIGASINVLNNLGNLQGIYHSTKNFTLGIGIKAVEQLEIQLFYISQPSEVRAYANSKFSVNLRVNLFKHPKPEQ